MIKLNYKFIFTTTLFTLFIAVITIYGLNYYLTKSPNLSDDPTTYITALGLRKKIDTTIRPTRSNDYAYANTTNVFTTSFKSNLATNEAIKYEKNGSSLRFFTPKEQSFGILKDSSPTTSGNQITYFNVFKDIDFKYTVSSTRLLEEIIVKSKDVATQLTQIKQIATTTNITSYSEQDGAIYFKNGDKDVLILPRPVMYEHDDRFKESQGIKYEIAQDGDTYTIKKIITEEGLKWLQDPDRKYPIIIDPVLVDAADNSNLWVSSDQTNTTVSQETTIVNEGSGSTKITTTASGTSTVDLMEYATNGTIQSDYVTDSPTTNATGGTITYSGGNTIHSFTSSGVFTTAPSLISVNYLVVGGGGGGGGRHAGGGGGGGVRTGTNLPITTQAYTISVGEGGTAAPYGGRGGNGGNSIFSTITSTGGGGGGGYSDGGATAAGANGGSGGGGANTTGLPGSGGTAGSGNTPPTSPSQGNNGGTGSGGSSDWAGAGGGGAGGAGANNPNNINGGAGGVGVSSSISGSAIFYGGGGGGAGGGNIDGNGGAGGNGGGGRGTGAWYPTTGIAGTPNTGGGGGGSRDQVGSRGGSGIVIISYPTPPYLQSYSESTIKTEGSYSLKGIANQTTSANKTLTKTIASPLDLSSKSSMTFDIRASRTGSNIKVGLRDSGGIITEVTPNITAADTFQTVTIDLSNVSSTNKDAINAIIITIVDAAAANTFYLDNLKAIIPNSLDDTVTLTKPAIDLSAITHISFWVRSSVAGAFARFEFGETLSSEQVYPFTINSPNTWEQKTLDIYGITGTDKNAVTKFAFKFIGDTSGAQFYFDDIQINDLLVPTVGAATSLSSSSIRWNFTDNSTNETGFKIFDSSSSLLVTCPSANISYCDETGLNANTQYTRKIGAYSGSASTIATGTVSKYTLAAVPTPPSVSNRTSTTVLVNPNPGSNPSGTLMAIYKETGSTCDGVGGSYLAANGSSNGATPVWQSDAAWGTITISGLTSEAQDVFCVKAKNGDNVETEFSSPGGDNGGYIPISGNFINSSTTTSINKYVDGSNPARYVIGIDSGSGNTNDAIFELRSGLFALNANETLVTGSMILSGGSMAIASGSIVKLNTPVWAIDGDSDGYTSDTKLYYGVMPVNGRRKHLLTTLATSDCADGSYNLTNVCCTVATRYQDADGDTYGNPLVSISSCPVSGYVDNNTDCYDGNALAKPGSTSCLAVNRGDGSYDYNCSNSNSTCGTQYNYSTTLGNTLIPTRPCIGASGKRRCGSGGFYYYPEASIGCGQSGGVCTATGREVDCSADGARCYRTDIGPAYCVSLSVGNQQCQ